VGEDHRPAEASHGLIRHPPEQDEEQPALLAPGQIHRHHQEDDVDHQEDVAQVQPAGAPEQPRQQEPADQAVGDDDHQEPGHRSPRDIIQDEPVVQPHAGGEEDEAGQPQRRDDRGVQATVALGLETSRLHRIKLDVHAGTAPAASISY